MNPSYSADNIQTSVSQSAPQAAPVKNRNKLLIPFIIVTVLAAACMGYVIYKQFIEQPEIKQQECAESINNSTATTEETNIMIDTQKIEDILYSKYNVSTVGRMGIFNFFYNSLDNFDNSAKTLLTIDYSYNKAELISTRGDRCEYSQENLTFNCEVKYDEFNTNYAALFGGNASRESYVFNNSAIQKITYKESNNSYEIVFGDGLGGVDARGLLYKIVKAEQSGDKISAIVVTEVVDDVIVDSYDCMNEEYTYTDDSLEKLYNTMQSYEFIFSKCNNDYCLTSVKKF